MMRDISKKEPEEMLPPDDGAEEASGDGLKRLQQDLYARAESHELEERRDELKRLGIRRERLPDEPEREAADLQFAAHLSFWQRYRRWLGWGGAAAAILLLFSIATGVTLWYRALHNVTAADLALTVSAPEQITSGQEVAYTVTYKNDSRVDWQAVEVVFEPPPGFRAAEEPVEAAVSGRQYVIRAGGLAAGEEQRFEVTGTLIAEENAAAVATAQLTITPENFPSGRFETSALATTRITNVPVAVGLEMPNEAVPGERVVATVTVTNSSPDSLENLYIALEPAPGLNLAPEDPEFSAGFGARSGRWELEPLGSLETTTRQAVLFVEGQTDERRTLDVKVGLSVEEVDYVQKTASGVISVAASELGLEQQYNQAESPLVVRSGQEVQGVIAYANSGTIALNDVVVTAKIEGAAFDPASLKLPSGAYNPQTQTITWTAASVPELGLMQPQQSGSIEYRFSMRPADALGQFADEGNNTVIVTTSIDSPSVRVPVGQEKRIVSSRYVFSVASDLLLSADAFYDDGRLGIKSSGPLPPQAGEETTYTVRLRAGSTVNDIGEVQVSMILPEGVRHTGEVVTTLGSVEYSERTGEVLWIIPVVPSGAGATLPAAEAHVQVALVPGEHQIGDRLPLVRELVAKGLDTFTETTVEAAIQRLSLPTTETAAPGQGRVE